MSPPAAAARPRFTSGIPNLALSAATTKSQEMASSNPPASAYPSTAAMSGLRGAFSVRPANPLPSIFGVSPVTNALRSMPEQNVPPAPVRMATRMSSLLSNSSRAADTPSARARLTAFLAFGRLRVMVMTPSLRSINTISSDMLSP